jgi:RNA binding exosome subunit
LKPLRVSCRAEDRRPRLSLRENLKVKSALLKNSGSDLSSKIPIAYIDLRVFAHATEDVDKVLAAVRSVIPAELVDMVVFKRSNLTGHHGNPIVLLETKIKDRKVAQAIFEKLSQGLPSLDKETLSNAIGQHVEKGNLYLRLDKQSAYLGELRLSQTDPIHFRIHFKKHRVEEVVDICRGFGLLP